MGIEEFRRKHPSLGERVEKARLEKGLPDLKERLQQLDEQIGDIRSRKEIAPTKTLKLPELMAERDDLDNRIRNAEEKLGIHSKTEEERKAA
jgi:hypothetical protein